MEVISTAELFTLEFLFSYEVRKLTSYNCTFQIHFLAILQRTRAFHYQFSILSIHKVSTHFPYEFKQLDKNKLLLKNR